MVLCYDLSNSELFDSLFAFDADRAVISLCGGDGVSWSRGDLSSVVEGDADEVGDEWNRVLIRSKPASQLSPDVRLCSLV